MAHRILLVPPPHSLTDFAKAALKPILGRLQKSIICQTRPEASLEIHTLDLGELETTKEGFQGDSTIENSGNPLAGEFHTTAQLAQCFQLDWVWLVLGCWLLSGPIMDSPDRLLPFADNAGLVACHSPRLRMPALDLVCGRVFLGFNIGHQQNFEGACSNIRSSSGGLLKTDQNFGRCIGLKMVV